MVEVLDDKDLGELSPSAFGELRGATKKRDILWYFDVIHHHMTKQIASWYFSDLIHHAIS